MSVESPVRNWRLNEIRLRMLGERCRCDNPIFPPRDVCPECGIVGQPPRIITGSSIEEANMKLNDENK